MANRFRGSPAPSRTRPRCRRRPRARAGVVRIRTLLLTRTALTRRPVFSKDYRQAGRPTA